MDLAWTYLAHPNYLVVQCLVHMHYLSPDTVHQMGPQIYHYVNFFLGRVGYMPYSAPHDFIMAAIDHSNVAMPFL